MAKPDRHSQRPWPESPPSSCTQAWFLPHALRSLTLQTVLTEISWGGDDLHSGTETKMPHDYREVQLDFTSEIDHPVFFVLKMSSIKKRLKILKTVGGRYKVKWRMACHAG